MMILMFLIEDNQLAINKNTKWLCEQDCRKVSLHVIYMEKIIRIFKNTYARYTRLTTQGYTIYSVNTFVSYFSEKNE